ncbi:MAG: ABC transporter ATP-binding protein [Burkholderiales bacterium]|nr:ABC transporter ATP-binding protein [Burkholderiales bacterium]
MALELKVEKVSAAYGAVRALEGVSISVAEGEVVALLGTNGNGKSTLMKCLTGLVRPSAGTIKLSLDGQTIDLVGRGPQDIVDLGVAMVSEGRRLFPRLTVEENLMLGAYRPAARAAIAKNLDFCFETFPVLKERRKQLAGSMSGGQQQMVAIARALMSAPRLLLVDEPSVGLSPLLVSQTIEKIGELNRKHGMTVLMAEQNFHQTIKIAHRGYVLVHGEIAFESRDVAELENNDLVKNLYLGA